MYMAFKVKCQVQICSLLLDLQAFNCGLIAFEKLDMGWFPWQQDSRRQLFVNKDSVPAQQACLTVKFPCKGTQ